MDLNWSLWLLHLTCWSFKPLLGGWSCASFPPATCSCCFPCTGPALPYYILHCTLAEWTDEKQFHVLQVCVGFPMDQSVLEGEGGVLGGAWCGCPFGHCLQFLSVVADPLLCCCEAVCGAALWTGSLKISGLEKNVPVFSQPAPPSALICNLTHAAFPGQRCRYKGGGGEQRKLLSWLCQAKPPHTLSNHPEIQQWWQRLGDFLWFNRCCRCSLLGNVCEDD